MIVTGRCKAPYATPVWQRLEDEDEIALYLLAGVLHYSDRRTFPRRKELVVSSPCDDCRNTHLYRFKKELPN